MNFKPNMSGTNIGMGAGALTGVIFGVAKLGTGKMSSNILKGLYPGNLNPSGSGRYGFKTNPGQDASGLAGMKFSYRRK